MALLTVSGDPTGLVTFLDTLPGLYTPQYKSQFQSFSFANATYKQLSATQIAASSGSDTIIIDGSGFSLSGVSLGSAATVKSLAGLSGTVTGADLYSGGSFDINAGTVTGGTLIAAATFSNSEITVTSGNLELVIDGSNLPNVAATVESIVNGSYSGPSIGISDLKLIAQGASTATLSLTATALTLSDGDYRLTLAGSFPTSITAAQIDELVTGTGDTGLTADITGATVTQISTGSTVLSLSGFGSGLSVGGISGNHINAIISNILGSGSSIGIDATGNSVNASFYFDYTYDFVNNVSNVSGYHSQVTIGGLTVFNGDTSKTINLIGNNETINFNNSYVYGAPLYLTGRNSSIALVGPIASDTGYLILRESANLIIVESLSIRGGTPARVYLENVSQLTIGNQTIALGNLANPIPTGLQNPTAARAFSFAGALPIYSFYGSGPLTLPVPSSQSYPGADVLLDLLHPLDGATNASYAIDTAGDLIATVTDGAGHVVNVVTYAPGSGTPDDPVSGPTTDVYTDPFTGDTVTTELTFNDNGVYQMTQVAKDADGKVIATYTLNPDGTTSENDFDSAGGKTLFTQVASDGAYKSFLRTVAGQLEILSFNASGQLTGGLPLTAGGAPLIIDSGTSVVGAGEDFLGAGQKDVFVRLSSGQLILWQFDTAGTLTNGLALTVGGDPLTIDTGTSVVGGGEDLAGSGNKDIFVRLSSGQLIFWQFDTSGQFAGGLGLTANGAPLTIDSGTSVIGAGEDFLGAGQKDVFVRLSSGQLILWQFDGSGQLTNGLALTVGGNPLTIDSGTSVVGGGEDFLGAGQKDVFVRLSSGQLIFWQFDASGGLTNGIAFTVNGAPLTIDTGTSVVGGGQDFAGSGDKDVFLRTASGQLILWQFDGSGHFTAGVAFTVNGTPLTIDTATSVVGGGEDFFSSGGRDVFLRTASGQLILWQFNSSGQFTGGLGLTANGAPLTIDTATSVIGGGEDLLSTGSKDVFLRTASGQLILWQFDGSGQFTGGLGLAINGAPLTIDTGTSVVGAGEDLLASGGKDVFLRAASGQLILWQFNGSGTFTYGIAFTANGGAFIIDSATTVIGAGHDSANGDMALQLQYGNGQTALFDLIGSALTPAPSGGVLNALAPALAAAGRTGIAVGMALPNTAIDMLNHATTPGLSSSPDGALSRLIQAMASSPSNGAQLGLAGATLAANDPALHYALAAHH